MDLKSLDIAKLLLPIALIAAPASAQHDPEDYRADAEQVIQLIEQNYAYRDRFPDAQIPINATLRAEADSVDDSADLLAFTERMLLLLRDHHAITGSSFSDSWALVPSYTDLWIIYRDGVYLVDAVRGGSPADRAGITAGMRLTHIGNMPVDQAVAAFWADLGEGPNVHRESQAFAARVLAAGRRDRERRLSFASDAGALSVDLPSMYDEPRAASGPITVSRDDDTLLIRFNDSLGDEATIQAFDSAMADADDAQHVVLDLTDTPSGGNTTVARGIMGWFVDEPSPYQIHEHPAEELRTGIARRWTEFVMPRDGMYFAGDVTVRVGRWTGSMGEGLAIGMQAQGASLEGGPMAGLLGAIYDLRTDRTGLLFKLPAERLYAVDGTPREDVSVP
ncbi:S41 family peptidase [Aurantiacibacter sediminis]|uniref:Peptidase S41 n=1 Tax=Aurantiacibacter sediminis TaxID=2793064 RepID=A0ABS0N443_9SPHN|nr:S41 family peptidase [Aurantiacibacter sediminis]MBH5322497.1 hypothetical protein [Aurantiacibacter sediminis]